MPRTPSPPKQATLPWVACVMQATPYTALTASVGLHLQAPASGGKRLGYIARATEGGAQQVDNEPLTLSVTGTVVDCALQPREVVAALPKAAKYFINVETLPASSDLAAAHECVLGALNERAKSAMLLCSGATEQSFKRASPTVMGTTADRIMLIRPVTSQSATASAPLEGCVRPTLSSHAHLQLLNKPFASVNWMPLIPVISKDWVLTEDNNIQIADTVQVFFYLQGAAFFFKNTQKTIYGLKPSPIAIRKISSAPIPHGSPTTAEPRSKRPRLVPE